VPGKSEPYAELEDGRTMPMGWNLGQTFEVGQTGIAEYVVTGSAGLWQFTPAMLILESIDDVNDDVLAMAREVLDGWFASESRIDWEYFIDRLAELGYSQCDPPFDIESYDSPAVRKIQRYIQRIRAEETY